jgi:hypothetical protein
LYMKPYRPEYVQAVHMRFLGFKQGLFAFYVWRQIRKRSS